MAVVLWAIGFQLWSASDKPSGDYQNASIVSWFDDARWTIFGGAALYALGTAARRLPARMPTDATRADVQRLFTEGAQLVEVLGSAEYE